MELIADLTLVLAAALVGGFVAHRVGQPLIVGYIVVGVIVGPFTGGLTVRHVEGIEQLAELGVALLLFSLGSRSRSASSHPFAPWRSREGRCRSS